MAMSDADKLTLTCNLAGVTSGSDDATLIESAYLPAAQSAVLNLRNPFSSDPDAQAWESRYDSLQCEIAAFLFSKRGAEGETTHNENGVNRSWANDGLPKYLIQRIVPRGKVLGA